MDASAADRSEDALAFAALDSEVRLAILDSLYERTVEPGALADDAAYSTIKSDVDIDDSGRFSYHLHRLVNRFVKKTDDGYRLAEAGREVVRLRRRGVLTEEMSVEARRVDAECYRCGSTVETFYGSGYLVTRCPDCPGLVDHELVPEGTLTAFAYPPSGVEGVDIGTAFERAHVVLDQHIRTMASGFCPECGRTVTKTFESEYEPRSIDGEPVGSSRFTHDGLTRLSCTHCEQRRITHPLHAVADHDPMADYFGEHGLAPGWDRFAAVMAWDTTRRADRLVFESPDGDVWIVNDDLTVTRE